MKYRKLGKTGIKVSEIGLGTEYFHDNRPDVVSAVVREAGEKGVNYIDVIFAFPEYRDHLGAALRGARDDWVVAGHIGCGDAGGQYVKVRDVAECERTFEDLLRRLGTDYVDIIFLQFVSAGDYGQVMGGMLDYARRMVREGKARHIGISGHSLPVILKAIATGHLDVVMFPRNIIRAGERDTEVLEACGRTGTGFVAMKPFAGGRALKKRVVAPVTPAQCLGYVLSDPRVSVAVPGFCNVKELRQGLELMDWLDAGVLPEESAGACQYCNHCQPCPAGINIGKVMRLLDVGTEKMDDKLREKYRSLAACASDCTGCGECAERCPFGVEVPARMSEAASLFGR